MPSMSDDMQWFAVFAILGLWGLSRLVAAVWTVANQLSRIAENLAKRAKSGEPV